MTANQCGSGSTTLISNTQRTVIHSELRTERRATNICTWLTMTTDLVDVWNASERKRRVPDPILAFRIYQEF